MALKGDVIISAVLVVFGSMAAGGSGVLFAEGDSSGGGAILMIAVASIGTAITIAIYSLKD